MCARGGLVRRRTCAGSSEGRRPRRAPGRGARRSRTSAPGGAAAARLPRPRHLVRSAARGRRDRRCPLRRARQRDVERPDALDPRGAGAWTRLRDARRGEELRRRHRVLGRRSVSGLPAVRVPLRAGLGRTRHARWAPFPYGCRRGYRRLARTGRCGRPRLADRPRRSGNAHGAARDRFHTRTGARRLPAIPGKRPGTRACPARRTLRDRRRRRRTVGRRARPRSRPRRGAHRARAGAERADARRAQPAARRRQSFGRRRRHDVADRVSGGRRLLARLSASTGRTTAPRRRLSRGEVDALSFWVRSP